MRWAGLLLITSCTLQPTCPAGDYRCLFAALSIKPTQSGAKLAITRVDGALLVAADAGVRLFAPEALDLDPTGDTLPALFEDPFGCQPAYCFSVGGDAQCIPAVKDGLTSGFTSHWLELGAQPVANTQFTLTITPVAGPGCPVDAAARLQDGDATIQVGVPASIAVTALRRPKSSGVDAGAPQCLQASTLLCTPQRFGGSRSRCITRTEYEEATGLPLPTAPVPDGTFGCYDEKNDVLIKPCMPTSTCRVGEKCNGGTVPGGVCSP